MKQVIYYKIANNTKRKKKKEKKVSWYLKCGDSGVRCQCWAVRKFDSLAPSSARQTDLKPIINSSGSIHDDEGVASYPTHPLTLTQNSPPIYRPVGEFEIL